MGLSEWEKQIALEAWHNTPGIEKALYAVAEAVLAERERMAKENDFRLTCEFGGKHKVRTAMTAEEQVKAKWPKAVALESSAYRAWIILENPSSNHVLSVEYDQPATAGTASAAWADAASRLAKEQQ